MSIQNQLDLDLSFLSSKLKSCIKYLETPAFFCFELVIFYKNTPKSKTENEL